MNPQKFKQLVIGRNGIEILDLNYFFIPSNFVRIRVYYSAISIGSESTTLKSKSILATRHRSDFFDKVYHKFLDGRLLFTLKKFLRTKSSLGYSLVGQVVGIGKGVNNFNLNDVVVATGEFATHAMYVDVPQGFVFQVPSLDTFYCFCTLAAISINGVETSLYGVRTKKTKSNLNILIVGGGSIGFFAGLYLKSNNHMVNVYDTNYDSVGYKFFRNEKNLDSFDLVIWTAPNTDGLDKIVKLINYSGAIAFIGEVNNISYVGELRDRDVMVSFGKSSGVDRSDLRSQISPSETFKKERRHVSDNINLAINLLNIYQIEVMQNVKVIHYKDINIQHFTQFGNLNAIDWNHR